MNQVLSFGINVPTSVTPRTDPVSLAIFAEELGFDFVSASDHPSGSNPTYEVWTMLTWIAAATSRISVASRVLSLPFRSPALVAKMAESLDRLSQGRLILGLGAGAADDELRGFGLPIPSPRTKIDGLEDTMNIIKGVWTESEFTYVGSVHHTKGAILEPKPHRPIPIWLGTFGNRALALTGRHADGWIPSLGYAPYDELSTMREKVLVAAQSVGRATSDIICALNVEIGLNTRDDPSTERICGPLSMVGDRLHDLVTKGFTTFNFMPIDANFDKDIERIATELLPLLRRIEVI